MNQDAEKIPQPRSRLATILNVPHGKERVLARLGWEGEIGYASGCASPAALLDGFFEHPVHEVFRDLWIRSC
jgi:hypothetical protein